MITNIAELELLLPNLNYYLLGDDIPAVYTLKGRGGWEAFA